MSDNIKNEYGKSNHYLEKSGENYFQWQNAGGFERGVINSRKFLPFICENDVVMDFGCGGGHTLAALNCAKKYGIELNPFAREEAKKYEITVYEDCSNIKNNSIDKVISNHALEHVPYPIEALKQIKECVVIGGKLILYLPIDDWRTQKQFDKNDINHHLYTWTPQSIGNCLSEAGFHVDCIEIFAHAWPPMVFMLNKLLPVWLFDSVCNIFSIFFKQRQIRVIASNMG